MRSSEVDYGAIGALSSLDGRGGEEDKVLLKKLGSGSGEGYLYSVMASTKRVKRSSFTIMMRILRLSSL